MKALKLILLVIALVVMVAGIQARDCGDVDGNGQVDISDVIAMVDYMFLGGPPPTIPALLDVNGSGNIDISDLVYQVQWMFSSGPDLICPIVEVGGVVTNQSSCLVDSAAADPPPTGRGQMQVFTFGDTLQIYHLNAYYQCCLMYAVEYLINEDQIFAIETDTGMLCDCYCPFNLNSISFGYDPGIYQVHLIGIEGNLIGSEWITIGEPGVIESSASGCLEFKGTPPEPTDIAWNWSDGLLSFTHLNAWFNCSFELGLEIEVIADTLRLYERNVTTDGPVYCMCYYEISGTIGNLAPGEYVVELYNQDITSSDDELIYQTNLVLD